MHISMIRWCINQAIHTINIIKKQVYKFLFICQNIYHLLIIKVISSSNISACILLKIFFMLEYKCMHVFSKTKCMHVYARGYSKRGVDNDLNEDLTV